LTVYADILFLVNLYIDALLLSAVRRFLRLPLSRWRWLLASALGGAFGLFALLPRLRGLPLLLLCVGQAAALVATAFYPQRPGVLLRGTFLLFLFGAALSGLLSLFSRHLSQSSNLLSQSPNLLSQSSNLLSQSSNLVSQSLRQPASGGILLLNGTVYFDLSPLWLVLCTCLSYGVLWAFHRLFRQQGNPVFCRTVTLVHGGKTVSLTAKVDTGLSLTEPFSGEAVWIAERRALSALLPAGFGTAESPIPFRPVPYSSIGGTGILPAFRPEALTLDGTPVSAWVAVLDRPLSAAGFRMLIGADALQQNQNGVNCP